MRLPFRLVFIVVLVLLAPLANADAPFAFATTPGNLPKNVVPIEYAVRIVPDVAARTFTGAQTVDIEVRSTAREIVLHALELEVSSAAISGPRLHRTALAPPRLDRERLLLVFALPRPLAPGRYQLAMAWRGAINGTSQGLYADRYATAAAGERTMLSTDMDPTNARRFLPCWDEPAYRARFRLVADLPANFAAFSNMPVARTSVLADGRRRTAFAATPRMPSYLLAFIAGELERSEGAVDGTRIGIVTKAGKQGSARYALASSRELLHYYNDYFGIRFPLPKLDHIAMPGGYAGAMENWGAIVYNESRLLVDPVTGSEAQRQHAYGLVAHEVAHQWFGNLVTMAWWDDLWLNEAFAEWMSSKASDRFHPQWHVWLQSNEGRERAMALDARATTHPIRQPVATESEAEDAFDDITYEKGAGFLRMVESWLGEATFRDGIRHYMARHRYGNTTGADLWAALDAASGQPVARLAGDWTTQPGFPVIDVDARCDAGRRRVEVAQRPFRLDAAVPAGERTWTVPLQLSIGVGAGVVAGSATLLQGRSAVLDLAGCDGALVVDADNTGFYRIRYAPALFVALVDHWPALPDATRLKLLADTSALVQADQMPLAGYFAVLSRIGAESRLAVWTQLLGDLRLFDRLLRGEPARAALHRFAAALIRPRFAELGWDERSGEPVEDRALRGALASALADYDDEAAIAEGRARFARFASEPASLPAALVGPVTRIAGRHADAATWEQMKSAAERSLVSEEKFRYYRALAEAQDPALAGRALQLATAREVPQIIRIGMVADVAHNDHLDIAWSYARDHADALLADMKQYEGGRRFAQMVDGAADATTADELEAFAREKLPEGALVEVRRGADEIRTRAALKARLAPQLAAALAAR